MKDYVVALIGRPNVGKSTLFNAILGSNDAITEKDPGITRDRKYGSINREGFRIILVDTGGYDTDETGIISKIREQTLMAVTESDISIFVVDGRVGLMPSDEDVAEILRKHSKPVILAVNKIDNDDQNEFLYEFNKLGIKKIIPISASHRKNLTTLTDAIDE
ncbi:GTP-binding protein, partial [Candidatus Calescamantes bacterium]|nr:GTP-binding protein [Candidatus Calescamantes bacterium]